MSIERPFLQVPYESLHLNFRHARQLLDQELKSLRAELAGTTGEMSDAQAAHLRGRLADLQHKLAECRSIHMRHARTLKSRAGATSAMHDALEQQDLTHAARVRVPVLVGSYLADTGQFPRTLAALAEREPQLNELVDWDIISEENRFVDAVVEQRDYEYGLKWCRHHRALLAKHGIDLEFRLQMLRYEHLLVDNGDVLGAIAYARKAFAKAGPTKSAILVRAAGALYGPVKMRAREPAVISSPLTDANGVGTDIGSDGTTSTLEKELRSAFRRVHGRGRAFLLLARVGLGLAALKTRQCGKHPLPPGHESCPACSPHLQPIAAQVPYAMHTTSILDDDVGVLPNNHIIGLRRLKDFTQREHPAQSAAGNVVDPESGEVFKEHEFEYVYPL